MEVVVPTKLDFTDMKVAEVLAAANAALNSIKDAAGNNTANGVTKIYVTTQTMDLVASFSLTTEMTAADVCKVVLAALDLATDTACAAEVSADTGRRLSKSRRLQASFKAEYTLSFPISDTESLETGQNATSSANGLTADSITAAAANNNITVVVSAVEPAVTSLVVKTVITVTKAVDVTNPSQSFADFESSASSLETILDSIDFDALSDALSVATNSTIVITASDVIVAVTKTNAPPSMPPPSGPPPSPPPPVAPPVAPPNNTNAGFTLEELIGIIVGSIGGGIILLTLALFFWRSKGKGAAKDEDGGFNTTTSQHV